MTRTFADLHTADLPGQPFDVSGLLADEYYIVIHLDLSVEFIDARRDNDTTWIKV